MTPVRPKTQRHWRCPRVRRKPALYARIGIETGFVVVDAAGEIYGDAPNTAARVQALSEPGTIVVTGRVQRQVAGLLLR